MGNKIIFFFSHIHIYFRIEYEYKNIAINKN